MDYPPGIRGTDRQRFLTFKFNSLNWKIRPNVSSVNYLDSISAVWKTFITFNLKVIKNKSFYGGRRPG